AGIAVVITFSRSSYIAFIAAVGLLGTIKSRKLLLLFIAFALASFIFIPRVQTRVIGALEIDETAKVRLEVYDRTFAIIAEDPWFGVGFNAFRYAQDREGYFRDERGVNDYGGHAGAGSDSSILFILATTGIPGLILFLSFGITVLFDSIKMYLDKNLPDRFRLYALTVGVSLVALFIHTQFVNSLFYTWIMEWYWVILGLMYGFWQKFRHPTHKYV
ncbi:O-antigen ligase family protein, partial [candidate division WWE3 bacterium]|nr:O-antigen ligase family protein [candidate division WWE3 bacterium]